MTILIIGEKPTSASRIAYALADKEPVKKSYKGVPYYELTHKNKDIIVGCAAGHLYNLAENEKKGLKYPSFDISWQPIYKISKSGKFTKKYVDALKKLSTKASSYYNACDYDVEGELIFRNILRLIYNKEDAKRMKFSTLTKDDLIKAYENASPHIDSGLAEAGETRHFLDNYWGISISRALMSSLKSVGRFKILSSGRVQGPALAILTKREMEILAFKPKPYWQIELITKEFSALHEKKEIWDKEDASQILNKCKEKDALVDKVKRKKFGTLPPTPFNLTDLQIEAYKLFRLSPSITQRIAQQLYTLALISYPRTSSQKLPLKLGLRKILEKLGTQAGYKEKVGQILKKSSIKPNEGKKIDEAHPAIHPTGEIPKELTDQQRKIYDLIVKRFISTFGDSAMRETMNVVLDINREKFLVSGTRTLEKGWFSLYSPYVSIKETILPDLKEGQKIKVEKLDLLEKETQPPKRYSQASIIRELETRNLGTKATRSEVLSSLYNRGYIQDSSIKVTKLGLKVVDTLEKYSPKILSEELTRKFEKEMEEIRNGEHKKEKVLEEARATLEKSLKEFKKHEKDIGKVLLDALYTTMEEQNILGKCLKCGENLKMLRSKRGKRFVGCGGYQEGCRVSFPLPQKGLIQKTNTVCKVCNHPIIKVINKGRRPWMLCVNHECPSKKKNNSS